MPSVGVADITPFEGVAIHAPYIIHHASSCIMGWYISTPANHAVEGHSITCHIPSRLLQGPVLKLAQRRWPIPSFFHRTGAPEYRPRDPGSGRGHGLACRP